MNFLLGIESARNSFLLRHVSDADSCRKAHDSFVLFVGSIHGPPSERDAYLQFARVGGQAGVLLRPSRLLVYSDIVRGRGPEIGVLSGCSVRSRTCGTSVSGK
jgi:hypothetical protein